MGQTLFQQEAKDLVPILNLGKALIKGDKVSFYQTLPKEQVEQILIRTEQGSSELHLLE